MFYCFYDPSIVALQVSFTLNILWEHSKGKAKLLLFVSLLTQLNIVTSSGIGISVQHLINVKVSACWRSPLFSKINKKFVLFIIFCRTFSISSRSCCSLASSMTTTVGVDSGMRTFRSTDTWSNDVASMFENRALASTICLAKTQI